LSNIDLVLMLILLAGAIHGFKQGFLPELFSLLALILGVLLGFKFLGFAMVWLDANTKIEKEILPLAAFGLIFVVVLVLTGLVGKLVTDRTQPEMLGKADKLLAALLCIVRTTFSLSVFLWVLDSFHIRFIDNWKEKSALLPTIEAFAPRVTQWIAGFVPFFKGVF
jgi:membrane protein required for colicin V production